MNSMKISVITASYNYAQYIEEAIDSVINQSYQNWELIVVDDGSSDNSVEIIKKYEQKDSRIKLFQHENAQNKGLKETLLLGISCASGDWIAFLESDDFFAPDNLAQKVKIAQEFPDAKLIFNKVKFISEEKRKQQEIFEKTQKALSQKIFPANMFYDFGVDNQILTFSSVMVEKNVLMGTDFNTPYDVSLDRWLWIHIAQENLLYYIDEELTSWRLHPDSYIQGKKPVFYFPQIVAYFDIYKKDKKPFKLGLFILMLIIKIFFVRVFRLIKKN